MPRIPRRSETATAVLARTDIKPSVRVASTANVNLSSPGAAIDGVTLTSGDRVLLKDQSTASQIGVYVFNGASSTMTRATDTNTDAEMTANTMVPIDAGTVSAGRMYRLATANVTVGTTSQSWEQSGTDLGTLSVAGWATITDGRMQLGTPGTGSGAGNQLHVVDATASGPVYAPTCTLILEDTTRPGLQIVGSAGNIGLIQFGDNVSSNPGEIYYDHGADTFNFRTAGTVRMTLDSSGDLACTGDLTVSGGKVTLTNGSTVDSESAGVLLLTEDVVKTSAALRVGSNVIQASDGGSTITMDTSDNVTIAGALNVGVQAEGLTSAGAISPTLPVSIVTPSADIAMTLADGSYVGQYKRVIDGASSGTDAITITPANMVSAKVSVTLNAPGEWVLFIWMGGSAPTGGWMFVDGYGAVQNDP